MDTKDMWEVLASIHPKGSDFTKERISCSRKHTKFDNKLNALFKVKILLHTFSKNTLQSS